MRSSDEEHQGLQQPAGDNGEGLDSSEFEWDEEAARDDDVEEVEAPAGDDEEEPPPADGGATLDEQQPLDPASATAANEKNPSNDMIALILCSVFAVAVILAIVLPMALNPTKETSSRPDRPPRPVGDLLGDSNISARPTTPMPTAAENDQAPAPSRSPDAVDAPTGNTGQATRMPCAADPTTANSEDDPFGGRLECLREILPYYSVDDNVLSDNSSAAYRALQWTSQDPNLMEYPTDRVLQRHGLVALYYATGGDTSWVNTDDWLSYNVDECEWFNRPSMFDPDNHKEGIDYSILQGSSSHCTPRSSVTKSAASAKSAAAKDTTTTATTTTVALDSLFQQQQPPAKNNGDFDVITGLWLWSNNVQGELPREFFLLTHLRSLNMDRPAYEFELFDLSDHGFLTGTLPDELMDLSDLEIVSMEGHQLKDYYSGSRFAESAPIKFLNFGHNDFTRTYPFEDVARKINKTMEYLLLHGNDYEQELRGLPTWLGALTALKFLDLSHNKFFGNIPGELAALSNNLEVWNMDGPFSSIHDGLGGSIPSYLADMTKLRRLALCCHQFTGAPPSSLGSALEHLELNSNKDMTWTTLPTSWAGMTSLTSLQLSYNNITSTIPEAWVDGMGKLEELALGGNHIWKAHGGIPAILARMASLKFLYLGEEAGSMPLSTEIGLFTSLEALDLHNQFLEGTLQSEIFLLTRLTTLQMRGNYFSGAFPESKLTALVSLDLTGNDFNSSMPTTLGLLTELTNLRLGNNRMTGQFFTEIGQLSSLQVLEVENMAISGTLPTELGMLTDLRNLAASYNQIGRAIPTQISLLSQLELFGMEGNQLSGALPSELGLLGKLQTLTLGYNRFTGTVPLEIYSGLTNLLDLWIEHTPIDSVAIPSEIGMLTKLTDFRLAKDGNAIPGPIPSEIALLTSLEYLLVQNQNLTGSIPSEIGLLSDLAYAHIGENSLRQNLPTELGLLTYSLRDFHCQNNRITGRIPSEMGLLTWLSDLKLDGNLLSGAIASELGLCYSLQDLHLANNTLTGTLPSELWALNYLSSLTLEQNQLSGEVPWVLCGAVEGQSWDFEWSEQCPLLSPLCGCECSCSV